MYKVGVDWGSSSFRAYRFNDAVEIIDTRSAPIGLKFIPDLPSSDGTSKFEHALFDQIGDWLVSGDAVVISGMITSRLGWCETPYIDCPADLSRLSARAVRQEVRGIFLDFLPGLCQRRPQPDVIRGEELQLAGVQSDTASTTVIMPGTHSKWAHVSNGTVNEFRTIVTGELFELLMQQSLIGQLATRDSWSDHEFLKGVSVGYEQDTIVSQLFSCRSAVLLEQLAATDVGSYLSGLLIGNELREGLALMGDAADTSIVLVGSDLLCDRYSTALRHAGLTEVQTIADASAKGFSRLIKSANDTLART